MIGVRKSYVGFCGTFYCLTKNATFQGDSDVMVGSAEASAEESVHFLSESEREDSKVLNYSSKIFCTILLSKC